MFSKLASLDSKSIQKCSILGGCGGLVHLEHSTHSEFELSDYVQFVQFDSVAFFHFCNVLVGLPHLGKFFKISF